MIIVRTFWAIFLAGMVGWSFSRTWKLEHGEEVSMGLMERKGVNTYVWMPPTYFIVILAFFLLCALFSSDLNSALQFFGSALLSLILVFSTTYIVLMLIMPFLRTKFSARACALLWFAPIFMYYNIGILQDSRMIPTYMIYLPVNIRNTIMLIWLAGFLAVMSYQIVTSSIWTRRIRKNSVPVTDAHVLALWDQTREELFYAEKVSLVQCALVDGPFSMGRFRRTRTTVLPVKEYSDEELLMIFSHEMHHLQRYDVDTKVFLCFCKALCWFNPLVWIGVKKAAEDLELSCDEIVAREMDASKRKTYASLLLSNAAPQTGFTTSLSAAGSVLRYRLRNVVNTEQKKSSGMIPVMLLIFLCVMSYGIIEITDFRGTYGELSIKQIEQDKDFNFVMVQLTEESPAYGTWQLIEGYQRVINWDEPALKEALNEVKLERLYNARSYTDSSDSPVLYVGYDTDAGYCTIHLSNQLLTIYTEEETLNYKVTSTVDWEKLWSTLDLTQLPAEETVE